MKKPIIIAVVAGVVMVTALATAGMRSAPSTHTSAEGPLRVSDMWGFEAQASETSRTVTFGGLDPCLDDGEARVLSVRPDTTVGGAQIVAVHVREYARGGAGSGGHFTAAFGVPPALSLADTAFEGTYVDLGRGPVLSHECDAHATGLGQELSSRSSRTIPAWAAESTVCLSTMTSQDGGGLSMPTCCGSSAAQRNPTCVETMTGQSHDCWDRGEVPARRRTRLERGG